MVVTCTSSVPVLTLDAAALGRNSDFLPSAHLQYVLMQHESCLLQWAVSAVTPTVLAANPTYKGTQASALLSSSGGAAWAQRASRATAMAMGAEKERILNVER